MTNPRLTKPRFGLDYAWTTISPGAHKSVGSSFACRYLSNDSSKNISKAEAAALQRGGVDVVAVWEAGAQNAAGGEGQGIIDARRAVEEGAAAGMPPGTPIYFAVDFDADPGQVEPYFVGAARILSKSLVGAYAGYRVVKALFDQGYGFGWQTYAWSGGLLDPRAQLYQFSNDHNVGGSSCDFNKAFYANFAQWGYKPAVPPVDYSIYPSGKVNITDPKSHKVYKLDENATVKEFDKFYSHRHMHPGLFRSLKQEIKLLHGHIWTSVNWDGVNRRWRTPPEVAVQWNLRDRRARWWGLVNRERSL